MNPRNTRNNLESEDQAFLRNFNSMEESPDFLEHLCNEDEQPIVKIERDQSKQEFMQEQAIEGVAKSQRKKSTRSKQKKKIFYRDKMAELMKPGQYVKQQYNYVAYSQLQHEKTPISKEEQLKRNRQSAKNSRQRKKEYVAILQKKNEENSKLIQELTFKLQQVTLERDRLKQDNHQQVNIQFIQIKNFLKSKAQAYENLQRILNEPSSSNEQIKNQISFMLERFSASGSERLAVMNYYMNQIIEDLISDIHKYFLTSSTFSNGFTPQTIPRNIDLDVMKILEVDIARMAHLTQKFKDRFTKEATVFKNLTQQFYRVFKSIQNQSRVIELVFIDMIKEFDSRKIAQLILWFQQNQFCRQVKRVRKQWIDQLKTGQEVLQVIRKQTKQQ